MESISKTKVIQEQFWRAFVGICYESNRSLFESKIGIDIRIDIERNIEHILQPIRIVFLEELESI